MTPPSAGILGLAQLRAHWSSLFEGGPAVSPDHLFALWSGLSLNVLEVNQFLFGSRPSFERFEEWIVEVNGGSMDEAEVDRLRRALGGGAVSSAAGDLSGVEGLSASELDFWHAHGFAVLCNAITAEQAAAAAKAVYKHLDATPDDAESWYRNEQGRSIWVRTVRNLAFAEIRRSPRVVKAFAQLWGREDLWATVDQGGLNPPERPGWTFPGPHLHWDYSLAQPHMLDVQGLIYLTDTPAEQGAFTCVPGFHKNLRAWLSSLKEGTDPRSAILGHCGARPVPGGAGDLVLWHAMLPHGASPNRGEKPRVVQYLSMKPTRWNLTQDWL